MIRTMELILNVYEIDGECTPHKVVEFTGDTDKNVSGRDQVDEVIDALRSLFQGERNGN